MGAGGAVVKAQVHVDRGAFTLELELEVQPGRTLALLGPNGAGKTTALAALTGTVDSVGTITVGDHRIDQLPVEKRRIGMVFQDYLLFPHLTVLENVAFGPRVLNLQNPTDVATTWLDRLGIRDLASHRPPQLSGGQSQRVALARALAVSPELLLLDEPLAALDAEVRESVREDLAAHLRSLDIPTIVVTHSFEDVVALAHDVVVLEAGRVTQRATVRELITSPATAYVRKLVAAWGED
jgi:molybdate transport system ATP-binding protein